ncbi:dihydropteroate synthase [Limosilactobacillus reuteri]
MIAVDTYKLPVMAVAIEAGVDIINDVQAFNSKQKLILMAKANVGMERCIERIHDDDNLTVAMQKFFEHNLGTIAAAGIDLERVILDQGIGYAKVAHGYQDYAMMRNIDQLNDLHRPIMVAISPKGFGQKPLNLAKEDRLGVTLIAETAMYLRGGRVLRVHMMLRKLVS